MSVADGVGPGASSGDPCHPVVHHAVGASILKDEDVLLVEHQRQWPGSCTASGEGGSAGSARCSCCGADTAEYSLFAVFDGHNGVAAARLVADSLLGILEERLPQGVPPPGCSPTWVPWREDVQLALVETLAELNRLFALKGILAGCTATLVLQYGWLLTCANLGDSRAVLDTGVEARQLTVDHRVATHKGERRRVEAMGNTIAPIDYSGSGPATRVDNGVGPLRIWPGGLCLSRAVGDFDVGDSVIPFPHVTQVLVPPTGARLLVASDGVWDAYEKMNRIGSTMRSWPLDACPQRLIQSIVRAYGGLRDDTSLVVADILPPGKTFPEAVQAAQARQKLAGGSSSGSSGSGGGGGGGCGCFGGGSNAAPAPATPPAAAPVAAAAAPKVEVVADFDVAAVMGLMPDEAPEPPGWYDEFVGEQLAALAAEAMACWQEANERRTGRRPATPPLDSSVRAARLARASAQAEQDGAWVEGGGGGMRRNASVFFAQSVAQGDADYADKFGHYKGVAPESLSSGSPGSSMHSVPLRDASVRAGGYRYVDASVRAGNRYVGDASVRAGSRFADASVRAGAAYYGGGGAGGPGGRQPMRADPSIRSGTAALRYVGNGSAAASGGGAPQQAEPASAEEAGRRHGAAGAPYAAAALAAAGSSGDLSRAGSDGSSSIAGPKNGAAAPGSDACDSASSGVTTPILVPRSVTFGAVDVVGGYEGGGKPPPAQQQLEDSPMDFRGVLAGGGGTPMDTILEG